MWVYRITSIISAQRQNSAKNGERKFANFGLWQNAWIKSLFFMLDLSKQRNLKFNV